MGLQEAVAIPAKSTLEGQLTLSVDEVTILSGTLMDTVLLVQPEVC